ncbi:hypothetical protein P3377_24300, partial [Vibrio parahaemolyticus]|nr:hypothetical protein [Vibrio parahaemolyticus]
PFMWLRIAFSPMLAMQGSTLRFFFSLAQSGKLVRDLLSQSQFLLALKKLFNLSGYQKTKTAVIFMLCNLYSHCIY